MVILLDYFNDQTIFKYYEDEFEYNSKNAIDFNIANGCKKVEVDELTKVCDRLLLDSPNKFPLRFLKGIRMNELHLFCYIDYTKENYEILYNLERDNVTIHFHHDIGFFKFHTDEQKPKNWYADQKRIIITTY